MKTILTLVIAFFIALNFSACSNSTQKMEDSSAVQEESAIDIQSDVSNDVVGTDSLAMNSNAVLTLDNDTYEFGEVEEGKKVEHIYHFTNTGKSPLIIADVTVSCGCTTPGFSKQPIKSGEKGSITIVFDSQNQVGMQHKIVTVLSNSASPRTILHLKGEVKSK